MDEIDQHFTCQECKLVLREPCQLICGHRKCQPCLNVQNKLVSRVKLNKILNLYF